jgi:hypothetical protein
MLEFIAIAVNLMVFEPYVRGSETVFATDSLNCAQTLAAGRAKSKLMQNVHVQFITLLEAKCMGAARLLRHDFVRRRGEPRQAGGAPPIFAQIGVAPVRLKAAESKEQRPTSDQVRVPPPQSQAARGAAHNKQMT